jgi:hypothetical protein
VKGKRPVADLNVEGRMLLKVMLEIREKGLRLYLFGSG